MRTVVPAMAAHLLCAQRSTGACVCVIVDVHLPGKTELCVERDEAVCEPAGDAEHAVVVADELEV